MNIIKTSALFFLSIFGGCGIALLLVPFLFRAADPGFIFAGFLSLALGILGAAVFWLSNSQNAKAKPGLLVEGRPGSALILSISRTGMVERKSGYNLGIAFNLLVQLPDRAPYGVFHHYQMVPDIHIPAIQPGMTVCVMVRPGNDQELIIDFDRTIVHGQS